MEVEDKVPIHRLYKDHIYSGLGFGAERWLSTLQRSCERIACSMVTGTTTRDVGGGSGSYFLYKYISLLGIYIK